MERSDIQSALAMAVEEVLETMFFTAVFDSDGGFPPPPDDRAGAPPVTAELHFHGSPSGGLRVSAPPRLTRIVGASFLGRDESEVTDEQAADVLCELANMICGSVLSRLESEARFQLSHPEVVPPEAAAVAGNAETSRWFDLGDGVLTASLELQQAA